MRKKPNEKQDDAKQKPNIVIYMRIGRKEKDY